MRTRPHRLLPGASRKLLPSCAARRTLDAAAAFSSSYVVHTADDAGLPLTLFSRAFFYVTAPPPASSPSAVVLAGINTADVYWGPDLGLARAGTGSALAFVDTSLTTASATPFPTNQWVCVEWELTRISEQAAVGNVTARQDGAQLGDLAQNRHSSVSEPGSPPSYVDVLWFGLSAEGPLQGYDVWIDDVYVDTSRVGCAK